MRELLLETPTHGRVLVIDPAEMPARGTLVGFHGYGQSADTMLQELQRIPGADKWRLVSVQALNRFYTRGDESVVASWMTRQDRDAAIADNIEYINRAVDAVVASDALPWVDLGFSQGASMASRIAARGRRRASGVVLLGGDIAPELKNDAERHFSFPPTLLGVGSQDKWYQPRADADLKFLSARGVSHQVIRYEGGHEFTNEFRSAAGAWMTHFADTRD